MEGKDGSYLVCSFFQDKPENHDILRREEERIVNQVRAIISDEIEIFFQYVKSPSLEVRESIYEAFGYYPAYEGKTLPLLRAALKTEEDEGTLSIIEESIQMINNIC